MAEKFIEPFNSMDARGPAWSRRRGATPWLGKADVGLGVTVTTIYGPADIKTQM